MWQRDLGVRTSQTVLTTPTNSNSRSQKDSVCRSGHVRCLLTCWNHERWWWVHSTLLLGSSRNSCNVSPSLPLGRSFVHNPVCAISTLPTIHFFSFIMWSTIILNFSSSHVDPSTSITYWTTRFPCHSLLFSPKGWRDFPSILVGFWLCEQCRLVAVLSTAEQKHSLTQCAPC